MLCMHICKVSSVTSDFLRPHRLQPTRLLCPWNSSGKHPGVGSHSLLQRIFPTQGSNPSLPHCEQIPHCLSHQGSPDIVYIFIFILFEFFKYAQSVCSFLSSNLSFISWSILIYASFLFCPRQEFVSLIQLLD